MDLPIIIHIFNAIICLLGTIGSTDAARESVQRRFPCRQEKNRYYFKHLSICRLCDKCHDGEGTDRTAKVDIIKRYGAVTCRPCRVCSPGTYNPRRAFKCKTCKDCAAVGRVARVPCAPNRNAVCGHRIKPTTSTMPSPPAHKPDDMKTRDKTVSADYKKDDVLDKDHMSYTHINIPALVVTIVVVVLTLFAIIILGFVVLARKCLRCRHQYQYPNLCVLRPVDTGGNRSVGSEAVLITDSTHSVLDQGPRNHIPIQESRRVLSVESDSRSSSFTARNETHPKSVIRSLSRISKSEEAISLLSSDLEEDAIPQFSGEASGFVGEPDIVQITETTVPKIPYYTPAPILVDAVNGNDNDTLEDRYEMEEDPEELKQAVNNIAKYIAPNDAFKLLGRELGVSMCDIHIIIEDSPKSVLEQAYQTMRKWMQVDPNASIYKLKEALKRIDRADILSKIRR